MVIDTDVRGSERRAGSAGGLRRSGPGAGAGCPRTPDDLASARRASGVPLSAALLSSNHRAGRSVLPVVCLRGATNRPYASDYRSEVPDASGHRTTVRGSHQPFHNCDERSARATASAFKKPRASTDSCTLRAGSYLTLQCAPCTHPRGDRPTFSVAVCERATKDSSSAACPHPSSSSAPPPPAPPYGRALADATAAAGTVAAPRPRHGAG